MPYRSKRHIVFNVRNKNSIDSVYEKPFIDKLKENDKYEIVILEDQELSNFNYKEASLVIISPPQLGYEEHISLDFVYDLPNYVSVLSMCRHTSRLSFFDASNSGSGSSSSYIQNVQEVDMTYDWYEDEGEVTVGDQVFSYIGSLGPSSVPVASSGNDSSDVILAYNDSKYEHMVVHFGMLQADKFNDKAWDIFNSTVDFICSQDKIILYLIKEDEKIKTFDKENNQWKIVGEPPVSLEMFDEYGLDYILRGELKLLESKEISILRTDLNQELEEDSSVFINSIMENNKKRLTNLSLKGLDLDEDYIYVSGNYNGVRMLDKETFEIKGIIRNSDFRVSRMIESVCVDNKSISYVDNRDNRVYYDDIVSIKNDPIHSKVNNMCCFPHDNIGRGFRMFVDEKYIYVGQDRGNFRIFDVETLEFITTVGLTGHLYNNIYSIHSDHDYFYICYFRRAMEVYDKETFEKVVSLEEYSSSSYKRVVYSDDQYIYIGYDNGRVYVFNRNTLGYTTFISDMGGRIQSDSIKSDDNYIYIGTAGNNCKVIDKSNFEEASNLTFSGDVYEIKIQGDKLYVGANNGLNIFQIPQSGPTTEDNLIDAVEQYGRAVRFCFDDQFFYVRNSRTFIYVYDKDTYELHCIIDNSRSSISNMHLRGNKLYVFMNDMTLDIYNTEDIANMEFGDKYKYFREVEYCSANDSFYLLTDNGDMLITDSEFNVKEETTSKELFPVNSEYQRLIRGISYMELEHMWMVGTENERRAYIFNAHDHKLLNSRGSYNNLYTGRLAFDNYLNSPTIYRFYFAGNTSSSGIYQYYMIKALGSRTKLDNPVTKHDNQTLKVEYTFKLEGND